MSVHTSIAVPASHRRRWPYVVAAAIVVAAAVAAVLAITLRSTPSATESDRSTANSVSVAQARHVGPSTVSSLMAMTPAELTAAFGTSSAIPADRSGPTLQSVLASMSPESRRYTERIMHLTLAQLAAGAAGSP